MTKIELQIHDDVLKTINKIKNVNDSGIELFIPEGSVLFDNIINLKLIDQQAESMGKSIQFSTDDEAGNTLISNLEGRSEALFRPDEGNEETPESETKEKKSARFIIPNFKFKFNFPKFNLSGKPKLLFLLIPLVVVLTVYLIIGAKTPKATAKIVLFSDPLTRSVTIKVKLGVQTNQDINLLKGSSVETLIQSNGEALTTGEVLEGEKAKGKVTIYNKTTDEVTLKKGYELVYGSNDVDYKFSLDSETTIPSSYQESSDPGSPIIPGEKETSVTAQDIGSGYNIDSGKSLSLSKYKKSELEAKSKDDFTGGKADKVKVVSATDLTALSKKLLDQSSLGAEISLKSKLMSPNKLIPGAFQITVTKDSFNYKVGDKTDKINLDQTVSIKGLTYSETDSNSLLSKLIDKLVPQGYSLSKKDWSVKIEPLGNSTNSILSFIEADLQATLKTSVIPSIDKEAIKKSIAGKTVTEAEKILGSVKNVTSYELNVSPAIPFFRKVPKDINRIDLVVENE
jgi:hypothetical protein